MPAGSPACRRVERIRRRESLKVLQRQTKRRRLSNRSRIGKYRVKSIALTVSEMGRAINIKIETIRHYERIGLLTKRADPSRNCQHPEQKELGRL